MGIASVLRRLPSNLASYGSTIFRRLRSKPGVYAFVAFLFICLALIRYCSFAFRRDPTSAFFDPVRGYERKYSIKRQRDAESFIVHNANTSSFPHKVTPKNAKMCVGVASVGRDGEQYVKATIGSLLDGLTPDEREEIFLVVLIAETTPNHHPVYGEHWLTNVVDKVLLYDVSQPQLQDLMQWEGERDYRKKAIFDYTYVLQRCYNSGAQWLVIVEDDTLAVRGWYPRTIEALAMADEQYPPKDDSDWLYLRLFFTEEFLGWNSEEWPHYLLASIAFTGMTTMALLLLRQFTLKTTITNTMLVVVAFICCPMCIALYFLAGRLSMQPLQPGVHAMPRFGCCAQGFAFSKEMAPRVIARLSSIRSGFVDEIIEAWANELNLVRWVVVPSLLQHIGGHSSKGDDYGSKSKYSRTVAEKIWNFGFEMYDDNIG